MNASKKHREEESFASRWSRRKRTAEQGDHELDDQAGKDERSISNKALTVESVSDEKDAEQLKAEKLEKLNTLTDEDMPDVSSLDENSDFSPFMSTGVSESLRKIALSKLFHGASFNIRDGLDEYDGDYTYFEKLDPKTITADMKHLMAVEDEKRKQLEAQALLEEEAEDDEIPDAVIDEPFEEPDQLVDDSQQAIERDENEDQNLVEIDEDEIVADDTQTDEEAPT